MKAVLLLFAWLCIILTVGPFIRLDAWWIRIFDFPRLQLLTAGVVILAIFFFFWNKIRLFEDLTLAALVLCLLYQGVKIYPYTPLASKQVLSAGSRAADSEISLLIANVLMENRRVESLLQRVREADADMVLAVETNAWWERQLRVLENEYRYTVKQPQDNHYGLILYSRLRLVDPEIKFLVRKDIPSVHTQVVLRSGDRIRLYGLHPEPPAPTGAQESTPRDAELLIVGKEAKQQGGPIIVAGDLNDVAWSYTTSLFQKTSGLLDPRIGRGLYNSYNANNVIMRWPLDHVFHSDHFLLVSLKLLPAFGSDHFPVFITLRLTPKAEVLQDEPALKPGEKEQVEKTIDKARQKEK